LNWALDLAPIFGPALLVFAVYILAKRNVWDHACDLLVVGGGPAGSPPQ
jgi:NADPH-dependent 2,4-dienoyl-CoA reductase/sulfur reductase-like enzyme